MTLIDIYRINSFRTNGVTLASDVFVVDFRVFKLDPRVVDAPSSKSQRNCAWAVTTLFCGHGL